MLKHDPRGSHGEDDGVPAEYADQPADTTFGHRAAILAGLMTSVIAAAGVVTMVFPHTGTSVSQ